MAPSPSRAAKRHTQGQQTLKHNQETKNGGSGQPSNLMEIQGPISWEPLPPSVALAVSAQRRQ